MNRTSLAIKIIGLFIVFAAVTPVSAHHSAAMFDQSRIVSLKGTVKEFRWVNPHALIIFSASDGKEWTIELTSPGLLTRNGWTKRSLSPNEKITLDACPLRDGNPGGLFRKATLNDGKVLTYNMQPDSPTN